MKKLLLFSLLFLSASLMAETDLFEKVELKYEYRNLPEQFVEPENRTYSVELQFDPKVLKIMDSAQIVKHFELTGWKKTDNPSEAYLRIVLHSENLVVESEKAEEVVHEKADKRGRVTTTVRYVGVMKYIMNLDSHYFIDGERVAAYARSVREEYRSEHEYYAPEDALDFLRLNKKLVSEDYTQLYVTEMVDNTYDLLIKNFGYNANHAMFYVTFINSPKNKDYKSQQRFKTRLLTAMSYVTADGGLKKARELAKPVLIYMNSVSKRYSPTSKKTKAVHFAMKNNIALVNFLLENYDDAAKFANYLIEMGDSNGQNILDEIDKVKALMEISSVKTRHYKMPELPVEGTATTSK